MKQRFSLHFAAVLLLMSSPCFIHAQEHQAAPPPPAVAAQQGNGNGSFITPRTASTQNLARAEQEDEEYVFKHSPSVRAFGKLFHLSPDAASLCFWGLNFIILAVFIGYFLYKGLPKAFRGRRERIEKQLVEARAVTEEANRRLSAVEERLARLDSEIASIRASAERDSQHDEERIKATMEEERRKIVQSSESEIAAAGAAAERRLRKFAAELAVERASSRIHLSEEQDQYLIRQFAAGLRQDNTNSADNDGRHG